MSGEDADGQREAEVGTLRADPAAVAEGPLPGRGRQHQGVRGGGAGGAEVAPGGGVGEAQLLDAGGQRVLEREEKKNNNKWFSRTSYKYYQTRISI